MQIDSSLTTRTTSSASPANPSGLSSSRDEFLRLFVAQLENQNPLDPQSGADMVAQLAQFSGVEQQVETNRRLAELTAAQDAAGSAGLANAPIAPVPPPTLAWDGRTAAGTTLPAGEYAIEVAATDAAGAPVTAQPRFATTVDAVEFTAGGQRLHLGHARVSPGAVITIARGGTAP